MKKIFTLMLILLAAATAFAGQKITVVVNNGSWGTSGTWDINRKPMNGDTIVIPAGITVAFNTDENLNAVLISIYGTLDMNGGKKLNLDNASLIQVLAGGKIKGQGSSDQIRIGTTHVFQGSDPDIIGPMYADNTTGGGFAPLSVMPVVFVKFYISNENNDVKIVWSTASEINNDHFEVERSVDGINFISVAKIKAAGNTNSITNYSYTDKKINVAVAYYRIKQVDKNGSSVYTALASVKNNDVNTTPEIFAASNKNITVRFSSPQSSVSVNVFAINGQSLLHQTFSQANYIAFALSNALPGVYVIQIIDQDKNTLSKKIVLN
jgi:hypothetical protein